MSVYSHQPVDSSKARKRSIFERTTKVSKQAFSRPYVKGSGILGYLNTLPKILAGEDFRQVVQNIVSARTKRRAIIWGLGAHVIKCGLNPILIDLMERGFLTAIALNGAGAIHDLEIAISGATSENVENELDTGDFGMSYETAECMQEAMLATSSEDLGLGECLGSYIERHTARFPNCSVSLLARAYQLKIPVTIHVAIGTDTIHNHAELSGALLGKASLRDFRLFTSLVRDLDAGGVYLNCGSAVILPEVFLKAIGMILNLGFPLRDFTTVNLDFIQHYRPHHNVVKRPTRNTGSGYSIIGHHEITLPLLAATLIESSE